MSAARLQMKYKTVTPGAIRCFVLVALQPKSLYLCMMRSASSLLVVGGLLTSAHSHPVVENSSASQEPCAQIANFYNEYKSSNSSGSFSLRGQLAYDCLRSMPFEPELAASFATEVKKYLQFHSTVDILSNPPAGYLSPATDLLGGITNIIAKAKSNAYKSHYDYDVAIQKLFQSANDAHLNIQPCSTQIFQFGREQELVSISQDGVSLPKLYTTRDATQLSKHPEKVSAVAYIDGKPAADYLETVVAAHQGWQDPDARYNTVFFNPSRIPYAQIPGGAFYNDAYQWPGSGSVTFKYENKTTETVETVAIVPPSVNFTFKTGKQLFEAACIPKTVAEPTSAASSAQPSPSTKPQPPVTVYPKPVIRDRFNLISGYYINSTIGDVAVLFIPTFSTTEPYYDGSVLPDNAALEFSTVASKFMQKAKRDGKKKIIIDVSGNNGGTFTSGEDLYKLFFPDQDIYTATRFRAHKSIELATKAIGVLPKSFLIQEDSGAFDFISYRTVVKPDQKTSFPSQQALYGPHTVRNGSYSSIYANGNLTIDSTNKTPIHGYGVFADAPTHRSRQPYETEDILILTDGYCLSTCASFVNLMKNFAGVKSIAFGGRPHFGPMTAVGGVKGAQSLDLESLDSYFVELPHQIMRNYTTALSITEQRTFNQTAPIGSKHLPLALSNLNVNFRNAYSPGDHDTPLQFVSEAADCRLFYTADTLFNPERLWAAAADAMWGCDQCVQGSQNGPGSVNAGGVAGFGKVSD